MLAKARRPYKGTGKQQKWEFQCTECEKWHKAKDVSVDHITPAGSLGSFQDVAGFVERLFVGEDGLQVLCMTCHKAKTKKERELK